MASGGDEGDVSGLQQVQAPILGATRPPQLFDARPPGLMAGSRLAARSRRPCGVGRLAAGRNLGGKLGIGYLQAPQMWCAAQPHVGNEARLAEDLTILWGVVHNCAPPGHVVEDDGSARLSAKSDSPIVMPPIVMLPTVPPPTAILVTRSPTGSLLLRSVGQVRSC